MKIAIFCGSSSGNHPEYVEETRKLGKYLAQNGMDVVYGGGKVGLMGTIADSAMAHGGKVYGVIPERLKDKELAHTGVTELFVVKDMHERKAKMAGLADAFVALPGGAGTLEEIFEAWTWAQLGYHNKPCAFYNTGGYWDPLLGMVTNMVEAGFLKAEMADMLVLADSPEALVDKLAAYKPPGNKWE
ncbi:TIGR00730 family Rossman fold protein [Parasalinivibrio latis]|uniref:LOG family protein n=1 Tax=Parasalinivibrio latis TaxID=2952610 RepID=UPI0030E4EC28